MTKIRPLLQALTLAAMVLAACQPATTTPTPEPTGTAVPMPTETPAAPARPYEETLIPRPVSLTRGIGSFAVNEQTLIYIQPENAELMAVGNWLAAQLGLEVRNWGETAASGLFLGLIADPELGSEGYELTVSPEAVKLSANQPAGVFYATQTLLQLLPPVDPTLESEIPALTLRDYPRFAWRGAMLDVARHFFSVEDVKRYIDLLAHYKINRLHLHLTDDQGWRIEIKSWPRLTQIGAQTQVGGGEGGFYTQDEYVDIVRYAAARYITVVPEVDMPGHVNAAGSAYPELSCADEAPKPYTGTEVGFSMLCTRSESTYTFIKDVLGELAALTPGPYLHIGGDESPKVAAEDYKYFVDRVQQIVAALGKQPIGWEEIAQTELLPEAIAQHWASSHAQEAVKQGNKIILSPASKTYFDMKYDASTPLGLDWAGFSSVQDAYSWDPGSYLPDVGEENILGIETALWSETLETLDDIEYMAFPRLPGFAELGWSPAEGRSWNEYALRLAEHARRFDAMEINFFRSAEIPWK